MLILGQALALVGLVCWIIVVVKFFQAKMTLHGVLGILTCGLWAFIWGWVSAKKLKIQNIMILWTVCYIIAWFTGALTVTINT